MRVIVFGGTSQLGQQILRKALDDGHPVTAFFGRWVKRLVREEPALKLIRGDPFDAGAMRGAISGQDAVIYCLGTHYTEYATPATTARTIVDAMVRRDVKRLVVATSTGDGLDETMISNGARSWFSFKMPLGRLGTHLVGGQESQERVFKESPLDWTIVRVPLINDKSAPGSTERNPNLSREDVATFLVKQLNDPTNIHRSITARSSQSPSVPDGPPPSDVAPPTDVAPPSNEPPAKGKFDDYPLDFNE